MIQQRRKVECTAQNKQRERCCQIRKLSDWFFYARRQGNSQDDKDQADQRAENHGIGQHALEKREYPNIISAEILQNHDGKDIINRNNNCNHGGCNRCAAVTKDIGGERQSEQHKIAPINRLNNDAAFGVFFDNARNNEKSC